MKRWHSYINKARCGVQWEKISLQNDVQSYILLCTIDQKTGIVLKFFLNNADVFSLQFLVRCLFTTIIFILDASKIKTPTLCVHLLGAVVIYVRETIDIYGERGPQDRKPIVGPTCATQLVKEFSYCLRSVAEMSLVINKRARI